MTPKELEHVENFSIWNNEAKIIFQVPVDLTDVDINDVVILARKSVEVYPGNLPPVGQGLNQPAILEFSNFDMPKKYKTNSVGFIEKLEEWASGLNAKFISYDSENAIVKLKVKNFGEPSDGYNNT